MRLSLLAALVVFANGARGWDSIGEMESDICKALTNNNYLLSQAFTNQLNVAINSSSAEMRSEAYMLHSICSYQIFLDTADDSWLQIEMFNATNSILAIGSSADKWQYWMSRFVYAGACCSVSDYEKSLGVMTNSLRELSASSYTNGSNVVERAILDKFEMANIGISEAMCIMAGMSAAGLRMGSLATNYANQVSAPYHNVILKFAK